MAYELKNIKVLGYTSDFNQCECCGKDNLKGTIKILDLNTEVVLHFGTTCAIKADKYDDLNALNQVKKEINAEKKYFENSKKVALIYARKLKISNIDRVVSDFLKWIEIKENRMKRFDWESYQICK